MTGEAATFLAQGGVGNPTLVILPAPQPFADWGAEDVWLWQASRDYSALTGPPAFTDWGQTDVTFDQLTMDYSDLGDAVPIPGIASRPGYAAAVVRGSFVIAPENPLRREIVVTNDSDTVIYLILGPGAVAGRGLAVYPHGGAYTEAGYTGPVFAVHENTDAGGNPTSGASKNVCVTEI